MNVDVRCSIENGIWLCQNCAKLIDNDPERFTPALLRAWRTVAEDHALHQVGKAIGPATQARVGDKWVSLEYPQRAGISAALERERYRLYWAHAEKAPVLTEFDGWEYVEVQESDGQRARLKIRDLSCEYLVLLKKRQDA